MSHIKEIKPSTIKRALRLHREWVEYNECNDPEMPEGREIILTNEIIQKIDFINCNLFSGVDLRKLNASNLDFSKKKFWRADFSGTLEELKAAIKKTHKNNPEIRKKYNLALEYIENMVKLG